MSSARKTSPIPPAEQADDLVRPDAPPDRRLIAVIVHQPLFLLKNWRVHESCPPARERKAIARLPAQLLVVAAGFCQEACPRLSLKLRSLVEHGPVFPSFRRHRYSLLISLRSQARAMLQSRLTGR